MCARRNYSWYTQSTTCITRTIIGQHRYRHGVFTSVVAMSVFTTGGFVASMGLDTFDYQGTVEHGNGLPVYKLVPGTCIRPVY